MKKLVFNGEEYQAEKIIKGTDYIIGKDINDKELFSFNGVSDFSLFTLKDNAEFDIEENLIDKLILDNISMQMQIDSLIESQLGGN